MRTIKDIVPKAIPLFFGWLIAAAFEAGGQTPQFPPLPPLPPPPRTIQPDGSPVDPSLLQQRLDAWEQLKAAWEQMGAAQEAARQAAAQRPAPAVVVAGNTSAADAAALREQQALEFFQREFAPWLGVLPARAAVPGADQPRSLDDIREESRAKALLEALGKQAEQEEDQRRVDEYLGRLASRGIDVGALPRPARIDSDGWPVFMGTLDANQAKDTFASAVWTNIVPELGLRGDGITVHM